MQLTKKITLGGRDFDLGPLNLRASIQFTEKFHLLGKPTVEAVDVLVDVIHASLALDYDDVDRKYVDRHINMHNQAEIVNAFAEVNGLVKKPEAPKASPGKKSAGRK